MNKKFYGTLLLGTLLLGSTIVSCKDYDDDIDNLQNQITQLATKADMQSEVSKLQSAVATAQAAAENKAAAAEQAAKDAAAKAQAAADAAAKAQGTADAAATVEALEKVAAEAAAAAKAAEEAKAAAETKATELAAQLAELQALAATLVSTEDFEAAKKELNDKYAELAAKIGETTGVTGMTGINLVGDDNKIAAGYGVWAGVHKNMAAAEWDGPKADEINAIEEGTKLAAWGGVKDFTFSVNPTDFDASKIEAFAIVNQFDEVAPIAFGTPKAVTRAAAGAWTLPVLGSAIYGDKAAAFEKNFNKANNQNGTMATLAAGQFAGALTNEFCTVKTNANTDATDFEKKIAFDAIDGTAALEAKDATVVLDAYITKISSSFTNDIAHDSVVYKFAYTGTTFTYDAEAVKKFMSTAADDKKIEVEIKEINLNGYIHTGKGEITFSKKEDAKPVVVKRIELDKVPHTIVPIVWNKSEGKNVNNQNVTVSILPALEKWGIDLSKTTEDATIHWNHTNFATTDVKVIADSVYYLDKDQMPVYLTDFADAELKRDAKEKTADIKLSFKENYKYNNVKKVNDAVVDNLNDDVDAAFNGKLIYIPVKMTGTDSDNGVAKTVEYSVVVPVKFNKIEVDKYYQWNNGKDIVVAPSTDISHLFAATAFVNNTSTGIISLNKPYATPFDADGKEVAAGAATTKYVVPSVTVSGQLEDVYRKALADADKVGYVDENAKKTAHAQIKLAFNNAITASFKFSGNQGDVYQSWMDIKGVLTGVTDPTFEWVVTTTAGSGVMKNYQYATTTTDFAVEFKSLSTAILPSSISGNVNDYDDALQEAKYTVNGLSATIMGRSVDLPGVQVAIKAPVAPKVGEIYLNGGTALNKIGDSYFYNSAAPAGTPANFDDYFTLKDGNKKTVVLTSASTVSLTPGFPATISGTPDTEIKAEDLTVSVLNYMDGATTPAQQYGIKISVKSGASLASGNKVKIPLTITNVKVAGLPDSEPQTLKCTLTINVK